MSTQTACQGWCSQVLDKSNDAGKQWDVVFILSRSTTKPTIKHVRQRRRRSADIHPVWSESLLCAFWVAKDPVLLYTDSEDSVQTGQMPRLCWENRSFCWFCHAAAHRLFLDVSISFLVDVVGGIVPVCHIYFLFADSISKLAYGLLRKSGHAHHRMFFFQQNPPFAFYCTILWKWLKRSCLRCTLQAAHLLSLAFSLLLLKFCADNTENTQKLLPSPPYLDSK